MTASDLVIAKLELVRDVTVAYLNNIYPRPLAALTEDARQKIIEQHRKDITEFIKSVYASMDKIAPQPPAK